jgi:hypothetical protein
MEKSIEEIKQGVLNLQRLMNQALESGLFVRSCTSCLQDSCNKKAVAELATKD